MQDLQGLAALCSTLATAEVDPPPQISEPHSGPASAYCEVEGSSYYYPEMERGEGQQTEIGSSKTLDVDANKSISGTSDGMLEASPSGSKVQFHERCAKAQVEVKVIFNSNPC